jgi:purine-binding chemotaxis protein CheW
VSLVVFEVGGVQASVAATDVLEVVAIREPTPVLAGPRFLAGVIAHRGAVIPLIDGRDRVPGAREGGTPAPCALLLGTSMGPVGLTIDRVVDVIRGPGGAAPAQLDVEAMVRDCREIIAGREETR